jgi:MFS family permease
MFIDGVARGIWNFLPIFVVDLRGNILDVAFLATLPGLASTMMQLPWGMVTTNHYRNKLLWAAGYLIIAGHSLPIAFATTPWQVIILSTSRALFSAPMGLSSGLFYWAALKPEIRARFMGINNSIGWFGMTLGSFFTGYLIQGYGYTFPFILFSLLNAACASIILRLRDVENSPDRAPLRQLFREGFASIGRAYQELPRWLREERDYTMYCIGIAVRGLGLAIMGPVFTIHLKQDLQATSAQIGELTALSSLVRVIVMPILGWIADRRSRKQVFLVGVVLAMFHPIIYVTRTTVEQLYPVYVMNGFFWACIESAWFAWQMDIILARRGIYMAILGFFNGTEWAIGPMIGGFIGKLLGFASAAGLSALAIGFGLWRLMKVPEDLRGCGDHPSSD